jgi:hypothetical protein
MVRGPSLADGGYVKRYPVIEPQNELVKRGEGHDRAILQGCQHVEGSRRDNDAGLEILLSLVCKLPARDWAAGGCFLNSEGNHGWIMDDHGWIN